MFERSSWGGTTPVKMLTVVFLVVVLSLNNGILYAEPGVLEEILIESACAGKYDRVHGLLSLNTPMDVNARDMNGDNALICAVSRNYVKVAELLLAHGADPDVADKNGRAVLNVAINQGNADMAKALIENGADPNRIDAQGLPPMFYAACLGYAGIFTSLIANGADVNAVDKGRGETVLIRTITRFRSLHPTHPPVSTIGGDPPPCSSDQADMIKLLLENGADIHVKSRDAGNAALHFAAARNCPDIVTLLIKHHADVNAENVHGETPLFVAAQAGMLESVNTLLAKGADPDVKNKSGNTPLLAVIRVSSTSRAYLQAIAQIAERLIEAGTDVSFKDTYARTYLMLAAESGKAPVVKSLLAQSKRSMDAKDGQGLTALMYAAKSSRYESAKALVDAGSKVYLRDSMGKTALLYAANSRDITALLLDNGARIDDTDSRGYTPLMQAVQYGNLEVVSELIDRGTNVDAVDPKMRQSSLMLAICKRNIPIVSKLLACGADVHLKDCGGQSAIHMAAQRGQSEVISLLLDHGSAVDAKDAGERTPLHKACENGHADSVELLLKRGADTQAKDNAGWSPLCYAVFNGHYDVCRLLIERGADTKLKDKHGRTLQEMAEEKGFKEILILLESHQDSGRRE